MLVRVFYVQLCTILPLNVCPLWYIFWDFGGHDCWEGLWFWVKMPKIYSPLYISLSDFWWQLGDTVRGRAVIVF